MLNELPLQYPIPGPQGIPVINSLNLDHVKAESINRFWLSLISDPLGNPIYLPLIIAKGKQAGPTLGLTAAVHGNELNGISVIQRTFQEIDVAELSGTLIGVPVVNVPSLFRKKRRFIDGTDLNHIMPGEQEGNVSQVYAWRFVERVVKSFDFLLDLHTASFGRVNSYYIRADLKDPRTAAMAKLQNAQIIVHNPPSDGTLRGAAAALGIPAITLEVGNPNTFQRGMIKSGFRGIYNVMVDLGMLPGQLEPHQSESHLCERSYWIYTDRGGILTVLPNVTDVVQKGQPIARLVNVFGDPLITYNAPEKGVVIGKSISPINQTGGRILHLGILTQEDEGGFQVKEGGAFS